MATTNYTKHSSQNPIQKALIDNFYKAMIEVVKPLNAKKILDVGCGEGFTLDKFRNEKIGETLVGIDYSDEALKLGKKTYPDLTLKKGDIYDIKEKDDSYDLVIATEVLEHLDDPDKGVEELVRISSKYVLISVPNEPFFIMANFLRGKYLKNFGNHPEHINHWTFLSIESLMKKHGLKIVKSKHPFAWSMVLGKK